jgi:hypothetical protein
MRSQLFFLLALIGLASTVAPTAVTPLNWVGSGNFTTANISSIHGFINSNFANVGTSVTNMAFARGLSDYLNSIWD